MCVCVCLCVCVSDCVCVCGCLSLESVVGVWSVEIIAEPEPNEASGRSSISYVLKMITGAVQTVFQKSGDNVANIPSRCNILHDVSSTDIKCPPRTTKSLSAFSLSHRHFLCEDEIKTKTSQYFFMYNVCVLCYGSLRVFPFKFSLFFFSFYCVFVKRENEKFEWTLFASTEKKIKEKFHKSFLPVFFFILT